MDEYRGKSAELYSDFITLQKMFLREHAHIQFIACTCIKLQLKNLLCTGSRGLILFCLINEITVHVNLINLRVTAKMFLVFDFV